ncbi:MAG: hypothetical protein N4A43_04040 [Alphaproteobacteria bacterium]|jgi:hypothetical protein|nr:hypothetical protein [Alphaproteobacteria bacterium]
MEDDVRQNINPELSWQEQLDDMYATAEIAKPALDNKGEDIASNMEGVSYMSVPLKGRDRAEDKIKQDYSEDSSQLTDIVRCSFVCDTYEQMIEVSKLLNKTEDVKREKNTMEKPVKKTGFRNMQLLTEVGGLVSEIQIRLKCIQDVADEEHSVYEKRREIEGRAKEENNRDFTKEEAREIKRLKSESISIYDRQLEQYNSTTSGQKIILHKDYFSANNTKPQNENKSETAKSLANKLNSMNNGDVRESIAPKNNVVASQQNLATPKKDIQKPKPKGFN